MSPIERARLDLRKMNAEAARLEAQLTGLRSRIGKAEAYIEMAAFYESDEAVVDARSKANGVAATAVRLCAEFLRERNEPQHTRTLLKMLEDRGVQIGGSNPVGNLSGFLSRAPELQNSRALGWGLLEWGPPPPESGTGQPVQPPAYSPPQEPESIGANGDLDDEIPF